MPKVVGSSTGRCGDFLSELAQKIELVTFDFMQLSQVVQNLSSGTFKGLDEFGGRHVLIIEDRIPDLLLIILSPLQHRRPAGLNILHVTGQPSPAGGCTSKIYRLWDSRLFQ